MNFFFMTNSPFCAAPNGANWLLLAPFPTLKRGANYHCAYGAIEIRASMVNRRDRTRNLSGQELGFIRLPCRFGRLEDACRGWYVIAVLGDPGENSGAS